MIGFLFLLIACESPDIERAVSEIDSAVEDTRECSANDNVVNLKIYLSIPQMSPEAATISEETLETINESREELNLEPIRSPAIPLPETSALIEEDGEVICVGCDDEEETREESPLGSVDLEINPRTGEMNFIIRDIQVDLGNSNSY
tara:strand:- start:302 stop:742 length:441 start_codon:yes stop_codon:yes gene_type:complete